MPVSSPPGSSSPISEAPSVLFTPSLRGQPLRPLQSRSSSPVSEAPSSLSTPSLRGQPLRPLQSRSSSPVSEAPSSLFTPSPCHLNASNPMPHDTTNATHQDDEEEDIESERGGSTPTPRGSGGRRAYMGKQEKLEAVVATLRRVKWSFEEMVEAWVSLEDRSGKREIRISHRRYHKQKDRQRAWKRVLDTLATKGICQEASVSSRCGAEMSRLVSSPPFNHFTVDITLDQLDAAQAVEVLKAQAPTWYQFIQDLLVNVRQHQDSYVTTQNHDRISQRIFTITSMICFSRNRKTSNLLPSCLDLYLLRSGVPRAVIETLAGLGVCHSYHHANSLLAEVSQHAAGRIEPPTTVHSA